MSKLQDAPTTMSSLLPSNTAQCHDQTPDRITEIRCEQARLQALHFVTTGARVSTAMYNQKRVQTQCLQSKAGYTVICHHVTRDLADWS